MQLPTLDAAVYSSSFYHECRRKSPCGKKVMIDENICKVDIPLTRNIDPQILEFSLFMHHHDHNLQYMHTNLYIACFSYPQSNFLLKRFSLLSVMPHP